MNNVGRLIEGIVPVKLDGKWKRKLCALERLATFTNSIKLHVFNEDGSICRSQDVHAYILGVDSKHDGTIMFVCTYKLRCISFEHFEEMTRWDDVLKANLMCSYFHANLIVAPKNSNLHSYACHRKSHRIIQRRFNHVVAFPRKLCLRLSNTSTDGYLHVTRDRICFTTGPGCSRPRLLATWTFDNDEIVQCGTARIQNTVKGDFTNPPSLFFLTAFPDHPEAPGSHLFLSDRAADLCDIIEHTNRAAVYQADWRRLTCMAALIDSPLLKENNLHQNDSICIPTNWHTSFSCSSTTGDTELSSYAKYPEKNPGDEVFLLAVKSCDNEVFCKTQTIQVGNYTDNQAIGSFENVSEQICVNPHCSSICDRRKWIAMNPRRRFSSHPVECNGLYIDYLTGCEHNAKFPSNCLYSQLTKSHYDTASDTFESSSSSKQEKVPKSDKNLPIHSMDQFKSHNCINVNDVPKSYPCFNHADCQWKYGPCNWRRSEPFLVTLPSQPLDIQKLEELLHRPNCSFFSMNESCMCNFHPSCSSDSRNSNGNQLFSRNLDGDQNACLSRLDKLSISNNCNCALVSNSCTQERSQTQSTTLCGATQCDLISSQNQSLESSAADSPCLKLSSDLTHEGINELLDSNFYAEKTEPVSVYNPHIHSNATQPICEQNIDYPSTSSVIHPGINVASQDTRRRKRLPSSWSTISPTPTGSTDVSANITAGHVLSNILLDNKRQTAVSQCQSSGENPGYLYISSIPTATVIPGSQRTRTCQHAASIYESTTSTHQRFIGSHSSPCSPSTYFSMNGRGSIKSSLVSLSSSAIPLWADAPTYAKPKTGKFYVSREEIQALCGDQQQRLFSVSELNHGEDFDNDSRLHSSNNLSSRLGNYSNESGTRSVEKTDGNATFRGQKNSSNNPVKTMAPTHNPITTNGCNFDLSKLDSTDSIVVFESNTSLLKPLPVLSGPYVNMLSSAIHSELQPSTETHSSIMTSNVSTHSIKKNDVSNRGQNVEEVKDNIHGGGNGSKLLDGTNVVLSNPESYVNLLGLRKTGFTVLNHSEASVYYMNLSPAGFEPKPITVHPSSVPLSSSQKDCQDSGSSRFHRPGISTSLSIPRVRAAVPTMSASLLNRPPTPPRLAAATNNVTSKITQLHYAHLTLSDNSDGCLMIGMHHHKKSSELTDSCENKIGLHSKQSIPCTISSCSNPSQNECLNCNCKQVGAIDDISSQELNYLTIDMRQTRALSELEQELRTRTGPMCNGGFHVPRLIQENCGSAKNGKKPTELRKHFTTYLFKRKKEKRQFAQWNESFSV
ncbi:unnamed protein product [Heterobilharzia americana]|nr:unnamed protein product [Heterobilharzia americana]